MDKKTIIQYGGRAGGAYLAYRYFGKGKGTFGMVASIVVGWVAGGFVADMFAASTSAAAVSGTPATGATGAPFA